MSRIQPRHQWCHTIWRSITSLLPVYKNRFEKLARIFSRRHKQTTFSDAGFLGILRVNSWIQNSKVRQLLDQSKCLGEASSLGSGVCVFSSHIRSYLWLQTFLTLVMLNKLRCHTHFYLSANQIAWSRLLVQICILDGKQCRSRSVGFFRSQLIWIYTACQIRAYLGSAGQGFNRNKLLFGLTLSVRLKN